MVFADIKITIRQYAYMTNTLTGIAITCNYLGLSEKIYKY